MSSDQRRDFTAKVAKGRKGRGLTADVADEEDGETGAVAACAEVFCRIMDSRIIEEAEARGLLRCIFLTADYADEEDGRLVLRAVTLRF